MNKKKYDAAYISYVNLGESAAVFVTRDIVRSINTNGKWIDILDLKGNKNKDGRWDLKYFIVELFPRKKHPVYPPNICLGDKKYITWKTARNDIWEQRNKGVKGIKFEIFPKLVKRNKDKNSNKPKWDYDILSIKRL